MQQWIALHPEIKIVLRDRSRSYAEGASIGAPNAVQIADRWHLLKNLGEYLERLLLRHHSLWRGKINEPLLPLPEVQATKPTSSVKELLTNVLRPEVAARHQARAEVYNQVFELFKQSIPIEQIAASVGKSTRTIIRWIKEGECRPRTRNRKSELDRYWSFIKDWQINEDNNVRRLWQELQKRGYQGCSMTVRRYLGRKKLVSTNKRKRRIQSKNKLSHKPITPLITPRAAVLKLLHSDKLKESEKTVIERILKSSPEIEKAVELGREFENLLMKRSETSLDDWLQKAQTSTIAEIKSFARV